MFMNTPNLKNANAPALPTSHNLKRLLLLAQALPNHGLQNQQVPY
jgi:hypothetical protein